VRFRATFLLWAVVNGPTKLPLTKKITFVARSVMSALLKHVLRWLCPHRLSWPHSGAHGQDYQVCLLCGTAFEYDTASMRRTGRVVSPNGVR
jgi:hypothetical protein